MWRQGTEAASLEKRSSVKQVAMYVVCTNGGRWGGGAGCVLMVAISSRGMPVMVHNEK